MRRNLNPGSVNRREKYQSPILSLPEKSGREEMEFRLERMSTRIG